MKIALLVIDLQRYYLECGHEEKLTHVGELITKTNELIEFFNENSLPIVRIQLVHKRDGSTWNQAMMPHWTGDLQEGTLTEGTWEAEPHPDVYRHSTDIVMTKTRGSAFIRTNLEILLQEQGIGTVILAGFSTNRCVGLTAIDAWERDFKVILAGDAVLGTSLTDGELMMSYLHKAFNIESLTNARIKEEVAENLNL